MKQKFGEESSAFSSRKVWDDQLEYTSPEKKVEILFSGECGPRETITVGNYVMDTVEYRGKTYVLSAKRK